MITKGSSCIYATVDALDCSQGCHPGSLKCSRLKNREEFKTTHEIGASCGSDCIICYNRAKMSRIRDIGEELIWCKKEDIYHRSYEHFLWNNAQNGDRSALYTFVLGNAESCSIYKSEDCRIHREPNTSEGETSGPLKGSPYQATIDEAEAILKSQDITLDLLYVSLQR